MPDCATLYTLTPKYVHNFMPDCTHFYTPKISFAFAFPDHHIMSLLHETVVKFYPAHIILVVSLIFQVSLGILLINHLVNASPGELLTDVLSASLKPYLDVNLNMSLHPESMPVNNDLSEVKGRLPDSLEEPVLFKLVKQEQPTSCVKSPVLLILPFTSIPLMS